MKVGLNNIFIARAILIYARDMNSSTERTDSGFSLLLLLSPSLVVVGVSILFVQMCLLPFLEPEKMEEEKRKGKEKAPQNQCDSINIAAACSVELRSILLARRRRRKQKQK